MLHLQWGAALPELETCVWGGGTRKEMGSPWRASSSPQLEQSRQTHYNLPQLCILKQIVFKCLFSEKPSRRSAYFWGHFVTAFQLTQLAFSTNVISKVFAMTLCIPGSCRIGIFSLLRVLANQCAAIWCSTVCRIGSGSSLSALHMKAQTLA